MEAFLPCTLWRSDKGLPACFESSAVHLKNFVVHQFLECRVGYIQCERRLHNYGCFAWDFNLLKNLNASSTSTSLPELLSGLSAGNPWPIAAASLLKKTKKTSSVIVCLGFRHYNSTHIVIEEGALRYDASCGVAGSGRRWLSRGCSAVPTLSRGSMG